MSIGAGLAGRHGSKFDFKKHKALILGVSAGMLFLLSAIFVSRALFGGGKDEALPPAVQQQAAEVSKNLPPETDVSDANAKAQAGSRKAVSPK